MSEDLTQHYSQILSILGEDTQRGGLVDTPKRAAKAMQFLTDGYEKNLDDVVNGAIFEADTDEMVVIQNIEYYSLCCLLYTSPSPRD